MPEADVAGKTQLHKGFDLLIQVAILILLIVKLLPTQYLALQFLYHIL